MTARLPFLAAFLLERFGPVDEELIGDVVEEYQSGRSRLWVWYQVFVAVFLHAGRTLRGHLGRAAAGIVLGWLLGAAWEYSFVRSIEYVSQMVNQSGPGVLAVWSAGSVVCHLVAGGLIGLVCRPFGPQIAIAYLVSLVPLYLISGVFNAASAPHGTRGWVVLWVLGHFGMIVAAAMTGAIVATGVPHQRSRG